MCMYVCVHIEFIKHLWIFVRLFIRFFLLPFWKYSTKLLAIITILCSSTLHCLLWSKCNLLIKCIHWSNFLHSSSQFLGFGNHHSPLNFCISHGSHIYEMNTFRFHITAWWDHALGVFYVCLLLISFTIKLCSPIHVVVNDSVSFFFMPEEYPLFTYIITVLWSYQLIYT
jgi:hypothetical protein